MKARGDRVDLLVLAMLFAVASVWPLASLLGWIGK